jgi:uncharacterized membrane protein
LLYPTRNFLVFGPSAASLYAITVLFLRTLTNRASAAFCSAFTCFTILTPILFIQPLRNQKTFESPEELKAADTLFLLLLLIGAVLLVFMAMKDAFKILVSWWKNRKRR